MMPCVYCIGCVYYRPKEKPYCARPDRNLCKNREYWCGYYEDERFPLKPETYKEIEHDSEGISEAGQEH